MKILGISGSPRRHGNTEILLDRALEGARYAGAVVEKIILNELCIMPCQGCSRCSKTGTCIIKDDMRRIYKKIESADGLIIASPVYFGSISAQLKAMIDRFEPYWVRKYILKRPRFPVKKRKGIFLSCAGEDRAGFFANAESVAKLFFITLDIRYLGGVFCGGISASGEVAKKKLVLEKAYKLGARLARKSC